MKEKAKKADERQPQESNKLLRQKLLQERRVAAVKAKSDRAIARADERHQIDARKAERKRLRVQKQAEKAAKSTTESKRKALSTISGNTKRRRGDAAIQKGVPDAQPACASPPTLTRRGRATTLPKQYQ